MVFHTLPGLQHGQAQQQLRGLAGRRHDVLVDGPLVAGLQRAALQRHRVGDRQMLLHLVGARARASRPGRSFAGLAGIVGGEHHDSTLPIGTYRPSLGPSANATPSTVTVPAAAADIDQAQLAALQERVAGGGGGLGLLQAG
jgi:hypothetical protein